MIRNWDYLNTFDQFVNKIIKSKHLQYKDLIWVIKQLVTKSNIHLK